MKKSSLMVIVCCASAVGLLACRTRASRTVLISNGIEVYSDIWERTKEELAPRAILDLNCRELSFALLRKVVRQPTEVAVTGCGSTAIYARLSIGMTVSNTWTLQSLRQPQQVAVVTQAPAPPPPEPTPAPPQMTAVMFRAGWLSLAGTEADLSQFPNCDGMENPDLMNLCSSQCNRINDGNVRNLCARDCEAISSPGLAAFCAQRCDDIEDPALHDLCTLSDSPTL
ncbi:MAG: hypothetical protein AAGF12_06910 [Myxococcota bacterium]